MVTAVDNIMPLNMPGLKAFPHLHASSRSTMMSSPIVPCLMRTKQQSARPLLRPIRTLETVARMATEKDQNAKDAILEKLSADMAKRQLEADEMENLRNELVIQETEERIIIKEREKAERAAKNKADIALANEYQRQLKAIRREE